MVWTVIIKNKLKGLEVKRICGPLDAMTVLSQLSQSERGNLVTMVKGEHSVWDPSICAWLSSFPARTEVQRHDLYTLQDDTMG